MSNYRKTMTEALQEMYSLDESVIDKVKEIASKKSAKKIDGVMVDSFTASAISQIYDKVNDANKKKMDSLPIVKLADLAFKMMQKNEFVPEEAELDEAQDGGDFKPHMMYDPKTGKGYKADTMDDHLRMKKMGYTHDAPKTEEVDLDEGKLGDQWQKGAKSVKSGSFELIRGKSGVHDIMKSGKKIGTFSYDDEGDNFVANMKGERGQLVGNDIDTLISNFKEEVDLDEVDRSTYDDRIKKFTGMLKDAEKEKPLDKKWISMLKDKIKSTNADQRRLLGMSEDVDLDEGKMSQLHQYIKDKKSAEEIAKLMKVDVKTIKTLMSSNNPEDVEESAASDARRAMSKDKDFSRKDSADDDSDATADDVKGASKNIMMQMRKAQSLNGRFPVEFGDGKKVKIPAKMAIAVQQKYKAMKRPAEKEKFQAKIGKSYKDMLSALKEELQPKKESILERMNRKIKENKDG